MAQLLADCHDITGPLIDSIFPPAEQGGRPMTPNMPLRKVKEHPFTVRRRRLRDLGLVAAFALTLLICVGWFRRERLPASDFLESALGADTNRTILSYYRERSASGFYEYGASFTLTHPSQLPASYDLWTMRDYMEEFKAFRDKFNRNYRPGSTEFDLRFSIFRDNLRMIHQHNVESDSRYKLSLNQFADMTQQEWSTNFLTAQPDPLPTGRPVLWHLEHVSQSSLPREVNWMDRGCVTGVKDQAKCGSCWAFSATGAIEGAVCAQTGKLVNLSEQQLVDCAGPEGTAGCNGGFMDNAFKFVIDNGGLCQEQDYPYVAKQQVCRTNCTKIAQIATMVDIPTRDDKALRAALAFHGPVAVGIEADKAAFQFYHKGVLDLPCGKRLNHAVLVVGYSHDEEKDEAFWYVKNSWGPTWGDRGFIRIGRKHHGKAGECGILLAPTVPIIAGDHDKGHPAVPSMLDFTI